ncbi:MAG: hypothetical protein QMB03_09680 [Spirosomataceae bacterium]
MNFVQEYFHLPLGVVYENDKLRYFTVLEDTRAADDVSIFYEFMFEQYATFLKTDITKAS